MIKEKAPYLVAIYNISPVDETVELYDWINKEKWLVTEAVYFETEISEELFNTSHLIIDVLNGKVQKNCLKNVTDQDLSEFYFKTYDKFIVNLVKKYFSLYPEAWQNLLDAAASAAKDLDSK